MWKFISQTPTSSFCLQPRWRPLVWRCPGACWSSCRWPFPWAVGPPWTWTRRSRTQSHRTSSAGLPSQALLLIKKRRRESSNVNINMFIFWIIFILKLPRKCLLAKKKSWWYTLYHLNSIQPLNRVLRILVEFISIDLLPAHPNDILVKVQTIHYY